MWFGDDNTNNAAKQKPAAARFTAYLAAVLNDLRRVLL